MRTIRFSSIFLFVALLSTGGAAHGQEAGDALPLGAVMFFDLADCPSGWEPYTAAAGRMVVPLPDGVSNTAVNSSPALSDLEDRTHSHDFSSSFSTKEQTYAATSGSNKVAKKKKYSFSGTTKAASSGLPYVQYLICRKAEEPSGPVDQIPSGFLMFTTEDECPESFAEATDLQGLLLVGVPEYGEPGLEFGASTAMTTVSQVSHRHDFDGSVKLKAKELAIASGCCNGGFAKKGTRNYEGESEFNSTDLPFIYLLQCEKS